MLMFNPCVRLQRVTCSDISCNFRTVSQNQPLFKGLRGYPVAPATTFCKVARRCDDALWRRRWD